jgi:hypothetical protein
MHKAAMNLFKAALQKELDDCIKMDDFGRQVVVKSPNIRMATQIWKIIKAEKLELPPVTKTSEGISAQDRDLMRRLW